MGDNEAGKSTLLEAINLVLTRQINGRDIQSELTRKTEELGLIAQGKTIETEHSAILFGAKDSVQNIVVKLEWRVEGSNKLPPFVLLRKTLKRCAVKDVIFLRD